MAKHKLTHLEEISQELSHPIHNLSGLEDESERFELAYRILRVISLAYRGYSRGKDLKMIDEGSPPHSHLL